MKRAQSANSSLNTLKSAGGVKTAFFEQQVMCCYGNSITVVAFGLNQSSHEENVDMLGVRPLT